MGSKSYSTLALASEATQALGIQSIPDYNARRHEDPQLPSRPDATYSREWQGYPDFFGREKLAKPTSGRFYETLDQASKACQALGIESAVEYASRYREDPRLPAKPSDTYKIDWKGFPDFFGRPSSVTAGLYRTLAQAASAAKALGILGQTDYRSRFREDPRLPSNPNITYKNEWKGFPDFLGRPKLVRGRSSSFYSSLAQAASAVQRLGITSNLEYLQRWREDPQLPSKPERTYKDEWTTYSDFFGLAPANSWYSLEDASRVVQAKGIHTVAIYLDRRHEDARLPSNPSQFYRDEWKGFPAFFGRDKLIAPRNLYGFEEARSAAQALGITTVLDYRVRYREDPLLPSHPSAAYRKEWNGFPHFLGTADKYYLTIAEAKRAVKRLGISSRNGYHNEYMRDPLLPSHPERAYAADWKDWTDFLPDMSSRSGKYKNLTEASAAVRKLGISTQREYGERRSLDEKLPYSPATFYKDEWSGWGDFTGVVYRAKQEEYFTTFESARKAAQKLNAVSRRDYREKCVTDARLPPFPDKTFPSAWKGWSDYLGTVSSSEKYATYFEAREACRKLSFGNNTNYAKNYKLLDPRLPGAPATFYGEDWQGWADYLGSKRTKDVYSFDEASKRVAELGIKTGKQYRTAYRADPMLPSLPERAYKDSWIGWKGFLSGTPDSFYPTPALVINGAGRLGINSSKDYAKRRHLDPRLPANPDIVYDASGQLPVRSSVCVDDAKYLTVTEASEASIRQGFLTKEDYLKGYKIDPKLPAMPHRTYSKNWKVWGWQRYLGTEIYSIADAGRAARVLGITGVSDYTLLYRQDPGLPGDPLIFFESEWQGWNEFLLPEHCDTLADVKFAVKCLKIKNSQEYREQYKSYSCLPAHPERVFSAEWVDWYDLCDIPVPYSYEEIRRLVLDEGVKGSSDYKRFLASQSDPRIPRDPATVYKEVWDGWFSFLNKPEPFKSQYIRAPYLAWKDLIDQFIKGARAGETKEYNLCRFVRDYIQKHELGFAPEVFFTAPKVDLNLFEEFLYGLPPSPGRTLLSSVKEFADYVLRKKLTFEDEETGERVLASNARNPFAALVYEGDDPIGSAGETNKHALAYQYVQNMCNWIIPETAQNFGDLAHLHIFDPDWVEVDPSIIDRTDPDCVFKEEFGKTKLWFPAHWMNTFALASVPARGKQLAYNDSGEADENIPQVVDGKIVWVRNEFSLAGMTDSQGFVKAYPDGNIGMHFTSNKTSIRGASYSVPWMPEKLAIWMIRLRNWQSKYNPITRVMPWLDCVRTELNEKQRRAKGANCFLFRNFGEEESTNYAYRLKDRLAAALFHSQTGDLVLAECAGNVSKITSYSTPYSPHSMRVSLITAYVMEFGLSIDIVMKLAGHSNIIMSLYYVKLNAEGLRVKFAEGEKRALANKVYAAIHMIEQNRIDEIRHELIHNNEDAIKRYSGNGHPGSFLFRDYGFCPFAGTRCGDGGPLIGSTKVREPIAGGYLGMQNCPRCRHFVTGPVFIGGLLSLANEISLQANFQFEHIAELEAKSAEASVKIDLLDDEEYEAKKAGKEFNTADRTFLEMKVRKLQSDLESASKKADLFLCDIQAVSRLINQSQALLNEQVAVKNDTNLPQLIVQGGHELSVAIEESSRYHLLSEVCENAEIYESASADLALPIRSQMIDKMIAFNNMMPTMYALDKQQQLVIGNQLTSFLLTRVKSWAKVDSLVTGKLLLKDLGEQEYIAATDIQAILKGQKPAIASDVPMTLEMEEA